MATHAVRKVGWVGAGGVAGTGAGLVVLAAVLGAAACATGRLRAQERQPATPAPTATPEADELLTRLEHAGEGITDLTAAIQYDRTFTLQGDEQRRIGTLYFRSGAPAKAGDAAPPANARPAKTGRAFAVRFDRVMVGNRLDDDPQVFIFDGEWLLEMHPKQKRFDKRQVVPPGERFDPLRIGEGPFPIPIGQQKADILGRYQATLEPAEGGLDAAAPDGQALIKFVTDGAGTYQLHLVPLPALAPREELKDIRLWYNKSDLLPRMARTLDGAGNESVVQLLNVRTDQKVPEKELDTTTPGPDWNGQVQPWREAVGDGDTQPGR